MIRRNGAPNASDPERASPMTICFSPTLDDLLADPLVQALMSADHVDAASLRREMTQTATRIARPGGLDLSGARVRFATALRPARTGSAVPAGKPGREPRLCC
jgi:hypothetical protein